LIKEEYLCVAKSIEDYKNEKHKSWNEKIMEKALSFLKNKILTMKEELVYEVNFSDEFKVLIKEAKHLEKMGWYKVPKTIINISL
jgi:hypothetical protein